MDYLPLILTAYGVFIMGVMSPGPNMLAIMGTSMSVSRPAGVMTAVGIATGTLLWSTLSVTGLTLLLSQFAQVSMILKLVGGSYLIWIGYKTMRAAWRGGDLHLRAGPQGKPLAHHYRRGLFVIMSNPKAVLFWLSVMSLVLKPGAPVWVGLAIVVGTTTLSISWYGLLALLFSTQVVLGFYRRARRAIDAVFGGFFTLIGGRILLSS